ncbi:MAG: hypothetical protein HYU66_12965 [Armatimonadetes bacterium]|nr:hypothetical protein [Armatimonadota bacterium]
MYRNPQGFPVLAGSGAYSSVFVVLVDGADLVVRNCRATWFGGANDPLDSGETASGVSTKRHPGILGCALPMPLPKVKSCKGSPLPIVPWQTMVRVYNRRTRLQLEVPVIDVGPSAPPRANAGIDLTQAAFGMLGGSLREGEMWVDFRIPGGARYLSESTRKAIAALPR